MVPVPPILLGALIDAVVTAVTKVIDKRMTNDPGSGIDAADVRQAFDEATTTLHDDLAQIRDAIASRPTSEALESTIRDLESRIYRALAVQAVGIVGMVAALLWVFG